MTKDEALAILKYRRLTIDEHNSISADDIPEIEKVLREKVVYRDSDSVFFGENPPRTDEPLVCSYCGQSVTEHQKYSMPSVCRGASLIPKSEFVRKPYELKPYEPPQVKEVGLDRLLTILERNAVTLFRSRLREHFRQSPKTSFGLGDILDGIDKVDP